jgi:hypothetical protein
VQDKKELGKIELREGNIVRMAPEMNERPYVFAIFPKDGSSARKEEVRPTHHQL